MGQHGRKIGWSLLLALSLAGFGCQQQMPRPEDNTTAQHRPAPRPAPPLEITNPPLPPPVPSVQPPFAQAPPGATAERVAAKPADQEPLLTPDSLPRLLPPVLKRLPSLSEGPPAIPPPAKASPLRTLYRLATERFANTPAFLARFRRREQVDGEQRPEELILFKYRLKPASIYMRWLGEEAKNREVVYVQGQYDNMLHLLPGVNDPFGQAFNGRSAIARLDSARGLGKERYPICETGIGALIDRFGRLVDAVDHGDGQIGSVKYLGLVKRPEFDTPVAAVLHLIPPGLDSGMPKGGQRLWHFDAALRFPVLVIAQDAQDQEVEYYCFDQFLFPGQLQDDEFNPANLGRR